MVGRGCGLKLGKFLLVVFRMGSRSTVQVITKFST